MTQLPCNSLLVTFPNNNFPASINFENVTLSFWDTKPILIPSIFQISIAFLSNELWISLINSKRSYTWINDSNTFSLSHILLVLLLLKYWEYKNPCSWHDLLWYVLLLLKSWEYKNNREIGLETFAVLLLLKSWEYKNKLRQLHQTFFVLLLLKSWEYKNGLMFLFQSILFYCYLNLESTKTNVLTYSFYFCFTVT